MAQGSAGFDERGRKRHSDAGGVVLWDVATRRRLAGDPLPVPEGFVRGVAFSPDGKTLAAGYAGYFGVSAWVGGVVQWDTAGRKRLAEYRPQPVPLGRITKPQ